MANFSFCFGQTYTFTVEDSTKVKDIPRLYNLYYLSKEIAKKNDNKKPNFKALNAFNILISDKKIDPNKHKSVSAFIDGISDYKKEVIRETAAMLSLGHFTELKAKISNYDNDLKKQLCQLSNDYDKSNENHLNLKKINDTIKRSYPLKSLEQIKKNLDKFDKLDQYYASKNDSIYFNLPLIEDSINNKIKDIQTKLDSSIQQFAADYAQKATDNQINKESTIYNSFLTNNSEKIKPQQIIINSQIQTAQAQTGSSGINIPSQSQMIEAMAIFLAKRAKQEAAIWFMDQIRLKMSNPMIFDVFPETIKVLEGVENYKVPTFNTTWKYAIAKDFVEMPRNLVNSPWVEKVIIKDPINHAKLKQSIEFGYDLNRLMTEQYNYRDIIKYFYINPRTDKTKENEEINTLIDNSATLLYIITNEFFSIDNIDGKDKYRLLTYEEIAGLNKNEFEILLELIDLKYSSRIAEFRILENIKLKQNREEVNKWIGNILTSLSQFDKIRNEYKTQKEEIKDDLASKNFYNVWSVLNQLTTNLYNDKLFTSPKIKDIKTKLEWVQTGMSIYEHFQNNDYVGAANETFGLMNIMKTNFIDEKKYKHYYYSFGSNKKISVNYDGKSFTIKGIKYISKDDTPNFEEDFVQVYFLEKDSLYFRIKNSQEFCISKKDLNEFLIISSYTAKNKNERIKLLEELLKRFKNKNLETLAKTLKVDQSQIIQLINYIQIAKTTINTDKTNIDEVFKKMDFNFVKEQSLNIISTYNDKYTKQLTNLLSFFGDVLTVKDEHQLAGVIDSYALPPTSYKLKRKQPSSIDLNAYVGAFGGYLASFKSSLIDPQLVYGITAPIGVAFTWSRDGWFDNYGFTVDALDLGNVVNHYLVKPKEDYPKDVHFSEVFSLGTTFLMGIKNSPFVLSGGFRFQPYNTGKDGNNKVFDAGIFHLGVKIDIPLIHLSGKDF